VTFKRNLTQMSIVLATSP